MNLSSFDPLWLCIAGAVFGYLIGSLSFAVIVSRLFGLADPRSYGSGNPGATNVLRSGNKGAAILTLVFDALKGYVPVVLALQLGLNEAVVTLVGLGAFLGHLWPVFFKFEGGKGVATAAGVLLGFSPALGGLVLLVWLGMAVVFRYSSLASLSAAVAAPIVQIAGWGFGPLSIGVIVMSALLIWRHEANIRKLLAGQESKLGQKAKPPTPVEPQ
ncbi:MAG: glycerol-3-phosphate 1-O-acyltransferase PlsY [Aquabacterium sp.]|jgi:glycerol-3-phosphate acyltransferase PlsY|uniref:glycerol-3-phosphate 1-O-acyltransferase PlsY n=1 Tax=Aquabacterium sp. G14 TaxID=3130164 RepID=UPI0011D62FEA|nr:MAG: glycerol-3-phosphate 1-O-acyltransferase PlsY [Aquabacterium sp.]